MEGIRIGGETGGEAFGEASHERLPQVERAFMAADGAAVDTTPLVANSTSALDIVPDSPLFSTDEAAVDNPVPVVTEATTKTSIDAPVDPYTTARKPRDVEGAHARIRCGLPPDASIDQMKPVAAELLGSAATVYKAVQIVFGAQVDHDTLMREYGHEMRILYGDDSIQTKWDTLTRMSHILPPTNE